MIFFENVLETFSKWTLEIEFTYELIAYISRLEILVIFPGRIPEILRSHTIHIYPLYLVYSWHGNSISNTHTISITVLCPLRLYNLRWYFDISIIISTLYVLITFWEYTAGTWTGYVCYEEKGSRRWFTSQLGTLIESVCG